MARLIFFFLAALTAQAQLVHYTPVTQDVLLKRLGAYAARNDLRLTALRTIFEQAGCSGEKLSEQIVKSAKSSNITCTLKGDSENVIVVGAHFDLTGEGAGVVDNWSGASMLASLYQGLAAEPHRYTMRFVGFAGEEKGLLGSKEYVKVIKKTKEPVIAMVNLDTLGLTETKVWSSKADKKLLGLVSYTATTAKLPLSGMNVERVGTSDSESFRNAKIPAITLHSLTDADLPLIHSANDRIEAINQTVYYDSYRLLLAFLAVLDASL